MLSIPKGLVIIHNPSSCDDNQAIVSNSERDIKVSRQRIEILHIGRNNAMLLYPCLDKIVFTAICHNTHDGCTQMPSHDQGKSSDNAIGLFPQIYIC